MYQPILGFNWLEKAITPKNELKVHSNCRHSAQEVSTLDSSSPFALAVNCTGELLHPAEAQDTPYQHNEAEG